MRTQVEAEVKFAFDRPVEEFKSELFNYDVSIIKATKAVSSHGVFCVTSSKSQPRLLSLTPRLCIVLLKKQDVVKSLSACLNEIKKENEKYYSEHYEEHKTNAEKNITYKNWPQYFYVVDEINRGNLSNIFGETFTLLENRDYDFSGEYTKPSSNLVSTALSRVIETVDNNDELIYKNINDRAFFGIPFNIHFIGIMNDVDRSIDPFDLALRRRFKWVPMFCNYEIIEDLLIENGFNEETVSDYIESCKKLNDYICNKGMGLGRSYEIGHAFFLKILNVSNQKRITKTAKNIVFENFILGTLQEYIRQVADESEVDDYVKKAQNEFGI